MLAFRCRQCFEEEKIKRAIVLVLTFYRQIRTDNVYLAKFDGTGKYFALLNYETSKLVAVK